MAELVTIARPYAEAAFEIAREESGANAGALADWTDVLGRLAAVAQAPELSDLIGNPKLGAAQLANLIAETAGVTSAVQRRFVDTLAANNRLSVLPQIASMYDALRNQHEAVLAAEVTSAFPLSDTQVTDIQKTLEGKYGRKVQTSVVVDPELIGGVTIRVGDEVLDASVRGKLAQMANALA